MTDKPSDRAIAQAFWEQRPFALSQHSSQSDWILERAKEIDAQQTKEESGEPVMSKSATHRHAVLKGAEPSAEHWRQAFLEWNDCPFDDDARAAWRTIEYRARELAKEGK